MRVAILTKEFPPNVTGGAGAHVEHLARELARLDGVAVDVRCFGDQRAETPDERLVVRGYEGRPAFKPRPPLDALSTSLRMLEGLDGVSIVHTHTWTTALAGFLARRSFGAPHVLTAHSLEPLRPWKQDELGTGGYELSKWMERTAIEAAEAVIAVSNDMAEAIGRAYPAVAPARIHVVPNGVDTDVFRPRPDPAVLAKHGVDPEKPYALFVGRLTEQKGVDHFADAAARLDRGVQVVLLASAPENVHYAKLAREKIGALRQLRRGVVWIEAMLPREEVAAFMSGAAVHVCPSVYEPFGVVNLEAMACEAPVVATAVGGIPEVVVDGETGFLVPPGEPEPMAARMNELVRDRGLGQRLGRTGRARVLERFTWPRIAKRTREVYEAVRGLGDKTTGVN